MQEEGGGVFTLGWYESKSGAVYGSLRHVYSRRQQQWGHRHELFFQRRRGLALVVRCSNGTWIHFTTQQQAAYALVQLGQEAANYSLRCP